MASLTIGITFKQFGWTLEASGRVFLKQHLKENDKGLRDTCELFNRQGETLMLIQRLGSRAPGWRLARQHLPERHAKRVKIRTDVYPGSRELLGTRELWCPCKNSGQRNRGIRG